MSMSDTDRFRTMLLEERARIEHAIAALRDDQEIDATHDTHLAETATVTLDREIDHTLQEHSVRMLGAVDGAIERLDAGTYGLCTTCSGAIPSERLEAYPWASLCIDCKRASERP